MEAIKLNLRGLLHLNGSMQSSKCHSSLVLIVLFDIFKFDSDI